MADTVAVSKSAVSRETIEASERVLEDLMERRLDSWDLLVIYVDGIQLGAHEGEQKLEQLARWLERDHPSAAASLREGLAEMFTINRLALPLRHKKCLGTTNLIDSTHSGARQKTRRGDELDERRDGAARTRSTTRSRSVGSWGWSWARTTYRTSRRSCVPLSPGEA
jgi:transposase-like protein